LRAACEKVALRFKQVEALARDRGRDLKSMRGDEIDDLWQQAKNARGGR